jgi:hypothetical protein
MADFFNNRNKSIKTETFFEVSQPQKSRYYRMTGKKLK